MTDPHVLAALSAFGFPVLDLQRQVEEAVAVGLAIGLTEDESREVIREMDAVYRELPASLSWAMVRERLIARSMGLPWRQADIEATRWARLVRQLSTPPPSPEREEKETQ